MATWRQIQRTNFTKLESLLAFLEFQKMPPVAKTKFSLNVPKRLAEKMEKNRIDDPIFRQFVPLEEEKIIAPGFVLDPVQDQTFCKTPKLLQKYRGRALLLVTSACAMHCRYCFRQNFPYATDVAGFQREIEEIAKDLSIEEVILSGGDPLSLGDLELQSLLSSIDRIPHVQRIRFHTRFPIGIPERIDDSFLSILSSLTKQVFFVIHSNHPIELDPDVLAALKRVQKLGIPVLNQSVLLRGVNDDPEILLALSETLINGGILPYYLHQLDLVQGASHFHVTEDRGLACIEFLKASISGFGVPRFVREIPGALGKTSVAF